MGPSPTYHPPEGEECETSVEHWLPLWAEPAVGYCSRRPRPSPMWGSRFVGARAVGPWRGEQKPLGKSPLRGNPSPESTYPPYLQIHASLPVSATLPLLCASSHMSYVFCASNVRCPALRSCYASIIHSYACQRVPDAPQLLPSLSHDTAGRPWVPRVMRVDDFVH